MKKFPIKQEYSIQGKKEEGRQKTKTGGEKHADTNRADAY